MATRKSRVITLLFAGAMTLLTAGCKSSRQTTPAEAAPARVAATADPAAGIRAFRRLGEQNLADFEPPRWADGLR